MDDLAELAAAVTGFAAEENMTVVPTVPEHDCGPEVCLGPEELDLPGFLALAARLGGGVIYQRSVPFDPDGDPDQPDDPPARLTARKGRPARSASRSPRTAWCTSGRIAQPGTGSGRN